MPQNDSINNTVVKTGRFNIRKSYWGKCILQYEIKNPDGTTQWLDQLYWADDAPLILHATHERNGKCCGL